MAAASVKEVSVPLSDKRFDKIVRLVSASYPYSCVCFITEIKNDKLLRAFEKKKEELEIKNKSKVVVKQLFHGTNERSISPICRTGFLTKFNRTSAYGIGTYFARDAKYSFNYMTGMKDGLSYMFLADVLIGNTCVGKKDKRAPMNIDTMVDNIGRPNIYVTPYDNGAYPRYIIAFHKKAM